MYQFHLLRKPLILEFIGQIKVLTFTFQILNHQNKNFHSFLHLILSSDMPQLFPVKSIN